ncbi:MAG: hypothetical protein WCO06_02650 [Candidatus Roizmanbacteria bacterium]
MLSQKIQYKSKKNNYNFEKCPKESLEDLRIGTTLYSVFLAKPIFGEWIDIYLKDIVLKTRHAYRHYYSDSIPLIDDYDDKSAIYLVRVIEDLNIDKSIQIKREKWYSMRFTYGGGIPNSTEDIDFYMHDDQGKQTSMYQYIKNNLKKIASNLDTIDYKNIISLSRICSTPSYFKNSSQRIMYEQYMVDKENKSHAGIAFGLMNKWFDASEVMKSISVVTIQTHYHMVEIILSIKKENNILRYGFVLANDYCENKNGSVCLVRNSQSVYIHKYPGYFFDLEDLSKLLNNLIEDGKISLERLSLYFDVPVKDVLLNPKREHFRRFSELFEDNNHLIKNEIDGLELKKLVNQYVKDGPLLYIMNADAWNKSIQSVISKV